MASRSDLELHALADVTGDFDRVAQSRSTQLGNAFVLRHVIGVVEVGKLDFLFWM